MTLFDAKGFDVIIPAWVAKLEALLPAAVLTVNSSVDDGWLVDVPAVLDYAPPPMTVTEFPTVGLIQDSEASEDDVGREWTGVYTVGIVTFVQCSDPAGLARVARRTVRAVKMAALADRRLTVPADPLMTTGRLTYLGTMWGPALADLPASDEPPSQYLTWAIVRAQSRHDEVGLG